MTEEDRRAMLEALARAREVVDAHLPQSPAVQGSQRWVDRRRALAVDLALEFAQAALVDEALDTRALAERMEALLHTTHEVAPGFGLDRAAGCVLEGLAGEGTESPAH
ncbi:MAG TPA: hypothetical protein VK013_07830 [Myxococcaceae bacterium]|nr:hypothetical protein [Myxococcaceae bacterium]